MKTVIADTPKSAVAGIVASLLMAILNWHTAISIYRAIMPWVWWALYVLVGASLIWVVREFKRGTQSTERVVSVCRKLTMLHIGAGSVWGSCAWLMLPAPDAQVESILIIGNAMVLMAVAHSRSNYRPMLIAFMVPATAFFVLGIWRLADEFHIVLGLGFIIFTLVLLSFTKLQEQALNTAVYLTLKTQTLLIERTAQQRETNLARQEAESAKQLAELANQGKTTFLTAAGHDLRQPMHAMVQYFGHLKRNNHDPLLDRTIDRIGKSIDSMQDLLDSIVEVSKLMMGAEKPAPSRFDILSLLDRIDAQMRPIAEDKGLSFTVVGSPIVVYTDELMLERILRNLTLNAIRYTDRGHVTVRARRRGSKLIIQVSDTGLGISKGQCDLIFEAFFQAANEARDSRKGLGLGLAIVRQLSDLLEAKVLVRSRPGKGSIFRLELPVTDKPERVAPSLPARVGRDFAHGAFVVLIDDNEESLVATEASLKEFGCEVLTACSAGQAAQFLREQQSMPQLVISDYRLKEGTGLDAIKLVVESQQALFGRELGIAALVISGDTGLAEMAQVNRAGFPLLHKPVRLEDLYDAVNAQLKVVAFSG